MKKFIILLGLLLGAGTASASPDPWTVMVYMDGDDKKDAGSLEAYAIWDFEDIAQTGSGDGVNVLVQLDRHGGDAMTDYGDWADTRRFFVTEGLEPTGGISIGEADMGDPDVLSSFIDWAQGTCPAEHYLLVLWYPGQSWRSAGNPTRADSTSSDTLTITEIAQALNGKGIDVVAFDTNGMAMIENAYELRNQAAYLAACPGNIIADGLPYQQLVSALRSKPSQDARDAAGTVVETYYYHYLEDEYFSAVDLSRMEQLASSLDNLSDQLSTSWSSNSALVKAAAADLLEKYEDSIVLATDGAWMPLSTGMTIYFPDCSDSVDGGYGSSNLALLADTDWEDFLAAYHSSMCPSWVADARRRCQVSDQLDSDCDLGHLARILTGRSQPYVQDSQVNDFQGGGTAQGWQETDESWEYDLPFSFPYYGKTYNSVWVHSNGFLDFNDVDPDLEWHNSDFDLVANRRISPLWSALCINEPEQDIYITENPDNVIFRWEGETFDTAQPVEMEVCLYRDGKISFNYGTGNIGLEHYSSGDGPTVGISYGDGSLFSFSCLNGQTDLNWAPTQTFEPIPSATPSPSSSPTPQGYHTPSPSPLPTLQPLPVEEGFDGFEAGVRPEGWSFLYCNYDSDAYVTAGNYGSASPSLKLSVDGARVTTREFSGRGRLSFWLKGNSTDFSTSLLVEQYASPTWNAITEIFRGPDPGDTIGPVLLDGEASRLRFTLHRSGGEMAFDDVSIVPETTTTTTSVTSLSTAGTGSSSSTTTTTATEPRSCAAGDYNGDGTSDPAIFRPDNGLWKVRYVTQLYFGTSQDDPIPRDYDGDGTWDPAYFRVSRGFWKVHGLTSAYFGSSLDEPIPEDFDGDGSADLAYFRNTNGLWKIRGFTSAYFGSSLDAPVPGDFNGDGSADLAYFRNTNGYWKVRGLTSVYFGNSQDTPVPADYDGDSTADLAYFRSPNGLWKIRGVTSLYFGTSDDKPVPGDYDGDGTADFGYWRPANILWKVRGITRFYFGNSDDSQVTNPW